MKDLLDLPDLLSVDCDFFQNHSFNHLKRSERQSLSPPAWFLFRGLLVKEDSLALLGLSDHLADQALKDPLGLLERKVSL